MYFSRPHGGILNSLNGSLGGCVIRVTCRLALPANIRCGAVTWESTDWWELFLNLLHPHHSTTTSRSPALIGTITANIDIHTVAMLISQLTADSP
jgi:hypothetical protein